MISYSWEWQKAENYSTELERGWEETSRRKEEKKKYIRKKYTTQLGEAKLYFSTRTAIESTIQTIRESKPTTQNTRCKLDYNSLQSDLAEKSRKEGIWVVELE